MKTTTSKTMIRLFIMSLLFLSSSQLLLAQPPNTNPTQNVCEGALAEPYFVTNTIGSTYLWTLPTGGTITGGQGTDAIIVDWGLISVVGAGPHILNVKEIDINGCIDNVGKDLDVTLLATNTVGLTSAVGTDGQTVCINTAITAITYATTGATGATITGLPLGVTGSWALDVVTISGTPTVTAGSPYSYTVTLTGGCGTISTTGTISVTPATTPLFLSVGPYCFGDLAIPALLTISTNGITGTWSPAINNTATTVYTFTPTTGLCAIIQNQTITINPLPITGPIYHN